MKALLLILLACWPALAHSQSALLDVEGGRIEGLIHEDLRIFKGIPFAAPPVGELRWKAPQPVIPWEGIRRCDAFGPSSMQAAPAPFMFWSSEFLIPAEPIGEDCLYLNVWTAAQAAQEKRPVLVYIHGGGFRSGGSACPIYDGAAMARKGVVFVSINYRVGVFGFLAHPELSAEADYGSSGNYALLDMIAALHWVQRNIAAFGGDPRNVTIAGQSAGAFAISYLTASPLAKGLFHRAIAQSGGSIYPSPLRPEVDLEGAGQMGLEFAEALGCRSLAELRARPAAEILNARGGLSAPFVDGYVLTQSCYETYRAGEQADVPLILGWNKDDRLIPAPMPAAAFRERMQQRFGDMAEAFFAVYPAGTEAEAAQSQLAMSRDETFGIQALAWAKLQRQTGEAPVFLYNFNRALPAYSPDSQFGAFHSGEIVYAYDNLHTLDRPWEQADQEIADLMSSYWASFAASGDPNGAGLPRWTPFTTENEQALLIDTESRSGSLPAKEQLAFWERYFLSQQK